MNMKLFLFMIYLNTYDSCTSLQIVFKKDLGRLKSTHYTHGLTHTKKSHRNHVFIAENYCCCERKSYRE